jgi:hypothetical protein
VKRKKERRPGATVRMDFSISWLKDDGSAGSVQLNDVTSDEAHEFLDRKVKEELRGDKWCHPLVAAIIRDDTGTWIRLLIDREGKVKFG